MKKPNIKLKSLRIAMLACPRQQDLADLTGISLPTIKELESGKSKNPTLETMDKIHEAVKDRLGIDLDIASYFR